MSPLLLLAGLLSAVAAFPETTPDQYASYLAKVMAGDIRSYDYTQEQAYRYFLQLHAPGSAAILKEQIASLKRKGLVTTPYAELPRRALLRTGGWEGYAFTI